MINRSSTPRDDKDLPLHIKIGLDSLAIFPIDLDAPPMTANQIETTIAVLAERRNQYFQQAAFIRGAEIGLIILLVALMQIGVIFFLDLAATSIIVLLGFAAALDFPGWTPRVKGYRLNDAINLLARSCPRSQDFGLDDYCAKAKEAAEGSPKLASYWQAVQAQSRAMTRLECLAFIAQAEFEFRE